MRRLFIMRKDLHMSPGKLAAQVSHCAEAYWTRGLRRFAEPLDDYAGYKINGIIDKEIFEQYSKIKTTVEKKKFIDNLKE